MEGNVFDVFRVLSLVVVWAIPAILVAAVVAFILLGPAMMLAGVIRRSYEIARGKLRGKARAEMSLPLKGLATELGASVDYLVSGKEGIITDTVPAIKADKRLKIKAKKALIAMVEELYAASDSVAQAEGNESGAIDKSRPP